VVSLPRKLNASELGESKQMALHRFFGLEKRLSKNASLKNSYSEFMNYLALGHMEAVKYHELEIKQNVYYLPHHAVIREKSSTTKLRVVFDASARTTSGKSLNDILHVGPTVQDDLISIMIRFRTKKIALCADIEKMYRQIRIAEEDSWLQLIHWRDNPSSPLNVFRLTTVTYGTAAAPFLATNTLNTLAMQIKETAPEASSVIAQDFYVDDLMTGVDTVENAIQLRDQLIKSLSSVGL